MCRKVGLLLTLSLSPGCRGGGGAVDALLGHLALLISFTFSTLYLRTTSGGPFKLVASLVRRAKRA